MQELIKTEDRFRSLFNSQSNLLHVNSLLKSTLEEDALFMVKTVILYFSDKPDPTFQNYLGSTLKYLLKMSWPALDAFSKKFISNLGLLCLTRNLLLNFDLSVKVFVNIQQNFHEYIKAVESEGTFLFQSELKIISEISAYLSNSANDVPVSSTSFWSNPKMLQDISLFFNGLLDSHTENESLHIIRAILLSFNQHSISSWGNILEVLLILFEKGDDRLHVCFPICFSEILAIHSRPESTDSIQIKCLQIIYMVIKTMNWTEVPGFDNPNDQSLHTSSLSDQIECWIHIFIAHLQKPTSAQAFLVFKIVDEVFKDQKNLTERIGPSLMPAITMSFISSLGNYLSSEIYFQETEDSDRMKDMESYFQYTLDEDQHYNNLVQAILIKYIDIIQSITFSQNEYLESYLQKGAGFIVLAFFNLTMMTKEDLFLWRQEPNQYIQEEDDETNLYNIKQAVLASLYSLIERYSQLFTNLIINLADCFIQNFDRSIRCMSSVRKDNFKELFDCAALPFQSFANKKLIIESVQQNDICNSNPDLFQNVVNFLKSLTSQDISEMPFILKPEMLLQTNSQHVLLCNLFTEKWKKMESTLLIVVTFINDILALGENKKEQLNDYSLVCQQLLSLKIGDVLTGRAIWAISTLKHFSTNDKEFLKIYCLICGFLSPSQVISVRLCASRTITKMSYKIASENKQELVANEIGEHLRVIHSWVIDLMREADDKTYHLIIDNLVSFYDICPGLLKQEISAQSCLLFLQIYKNNQTNSILNSCFLQLFRKLCEFSEARHTFWPLLVDYSKAFFSEVFQARRTGQMEYEKKIDNLNFVLDLLGSFGTITYFINFCA